MEFIILVILWYRRDTMMLIGYLILVSCMPQVDMFSLLVVLAVSCRSCKQTISTRSTMEAELATLDIAIVEVNCLRELLMDLPIVEKPLSTILMNCDNQTGIVKLDYSKDDMKSSRHIKRWLKFVRKMRNSRVITLDYIHTEKKLIDLFTKGLSRNVIDAASKC
jgi:hypothetical protein